MLAGHGWERGSGVETKVFWFFSSEKNTLASLQTHLAIIRKDEPRPVR
jgi:hypothetical protein